MATTGEDGPTEGVAPESGSARADPATAATEIPATAQLPPEELEGRRAALAELMELMSEAVQQDGGDLVLSDVDYEQGIVEVELQGACGSCAISSMTLQSGVERMLKERLSWVREVRGGVDESVDYYESASLGRGAYVPKYY
ncbi:MAG: NifU family protein [Acidimicrobiales bacterium]|jgi:Fe-S cluster biogenesis protein NfuA